jgi:DNA-directed RNA polymerase subunit M/transcription elongation factor TFIIS
MPFISLRCSACGHCEQSDSQALISRLQGAGLLKRATRAEQKDVPYLLALAQTVSDRWPCPACGAGGLTVEEAEGPADDFERGQLCAACGNGIPAERMELFPDATLCTACQAIVDRGGSPNTQEYCPRCGSLMQIRAGRGSGVARYALVCPQCRR